MKSVLPIGSRQWVICISMKSVNTLYIPQLTCFYCYFTNHYFRPNITTYLRSTFAQVSKQVKLRKIHSPSQRVKIFRGNRGKSTEMNKVQRKQENHPSKCSARSTGA